VLATGTLEQIDPNEMSVEEIEQYGDARRPLFEIWGQGKDELDINLYRLRPDELSGRRTEVYTAIRNLRSKGLEDILLTGHDGYFLDPDIPFEWLD